MKQVIIIGGGASGLMAGITAARKGASVTILEKCEKPGKKILATGNGRCNLTNTVQEPGCYHGDASFIEIILGQWSCEDTLHFFRDLGLWTRERDGWVYPRTDQASTVLTLLLAEYSRLKGKMKTREEVTGIRKENGRFTVLTAGWKYEADAVIVACGTPASNIEGVSSDALTLSESFRTRTGEAGIHYLPFRPSLVPLRCVRENFFAKWAGVRTQAEIRLIRKGETLQTEMGEIQLTDYGISGIPVFQLSCRAGELLSAGEKPYVEVNFLPDLSLKEIREKIQMLKMRDPDKKGGQLLTGLLPDKLIAAFSGKKITAEQILTKASCCTLRIASCGHLKQAQVCAGGILLSDLTEQMEAKAVPGLYFTGECTNVDGRCGGYNLQWAWSTGAVAGRAAAQNGSTG